MSARDHFIPVVPIRHWTYKAIESLYRLEGNLQINAIKSVQYVDFDLTTPTTPAEGRITWNDVDKTLNVGMAGGKVNLQVGQESLIRVKNDTANDIPNGKAVFISGGIGSNPTIALADKSSIWTRSVIGLATEDISKGGFGYITTFGLVRDLNTWAFATGGVVWLGDDGNWLTIPPDAPDFPTVIGVVIRKHASEGVVFVQTAVVPRLVSLADVHGTGSDPTSDGSLMSWVNSASRWEYDSGYWDDEKFPAIPSQKNPAVGNPAFDYTNLGWTFRNNQTDGPINGIGQFSHSRVPGTDIQPHVHWTQAQAGVSYWKLEYKWYDNGSAIPGAWTTIYSTVNAFTYVAGTIGQITIFTNIDGSGITGLSSVFKWKLTRLGSHVNDTYGADLLMDEFDVHFKGNRLGSRNEASG
jgi:hypothetical protein